MFERCEHGIIGFPIFKRGDTVGFRFIPGIEEEERFFVGTVFITDPHGTFEQSDEPSYDIMVENFRNKGPCLVKHIRESSCYKEVNDADN